METVTQGRRTVQWAAALVFGVIIGVVLVDQVSASQGPPDGLNVREMNVDENGNIKVAEQGITGVKIVDGSLTVDGTVDAQQAGPWEVGIVGTPTVNVANLPATATPIFDSTGFMDSIQLAVKLIVPRDVVVTDIFGWFGRNPPNVPNERGCRVNVKQVATTDEVVWWSQETNEVDLHLTTGIPGPLEISVVRLGDNCQFGVLSWTGYSVSP